VKISEAWILALVGGMRGLLERELWEVWRRYTYMR